MTVAKKRRISASIAAPILNRVLHHAWEMMRLTNTCDSEDFKNLHQVGLSISTQISPKGFWKQHFSCTFFYTLTVYGYDTFFLYRPIRNAGFFLQSKLILSDIQSLNKVSSRLSHFSFKLSILYTVKHQFDCISFCWPFGKSLQRSPQLNVYKWYTPQFQTCHSIPFQYTKE